MTIRKWLGAIGVVFILVAALPVLGWWGSDSENKTEVTSEVKELGWEKLVPEGFRPAENPLASMTESEIDRLMDGSEASNNILAEMEVQMSYAPTVPQLDGQRIKIPGYVVPLEFDGQSEMNEFLIVPYFGACIHTPPPPANQVIHANSEKTLTMENPYDPIWAIGVLKTDTKISEMAEAGYQLEIEQILPYTY